MKIAPEKTPPGGALVASAGFGVAPKRTLQTRRRVSARGFLCRASGSPCRRDAGTGARDERAPRRLALVLLLCSVAVLRGSAEPPVEAIYPSGDAVPANHLKFYIHFSEPMRQGVFLDYCRLLDERGNAVPEPFRETELWSEDGRRLTLWLHPGRQKTGVNLNTELGPVLLPQRSCTLVISGKWPRESGAAAGEDFRKTFRTTERAIQQLDCATWRPLLPLRAGTMDPVVIRFAEPLDHALLLRCLSVVDASGGPVMGHVATDDHERVWRFTPDSPWRSGPHRVLVESKLEDLAGNSIARPFEVDLEAAPPRAMPAFVEIPFQPARGGK